MCTRKTQRASSEKVEGTCAVLSGWLPCSSAALTPRAQVGRDRDRQQVSRRAASCALLTDAH
eukprot:6173308-Pleurochrysis_carterae.AAC.1